MKIRITILMCLLLFVAQAQPQMKGMLGIPFGSSKQAVIQLMKQKQPDALFYSEQGDKYIMQKGSFAGKPVLLWVFSFVDNKLHTAKVVLDLSREIEIYELYRTMCTNINEKYYVSSHFVNDCRYPYDSGDIESLTALKGGYLRCFTIWNFNQEGFVDDANGQSCIMVEITPDVVVKISFQDGKLIDEALFKQSQKNQNDY